MVKHTYYYPSCAQSCFESMYENNHRQLGGLSLNTMHFVGFHFCYIFIAWHFIISSVLYIILCLFHFLIIDYIRTAFISQHPITKTAIQSNLFPSHGRLTKFYQITHLEGNFIAENSQYITRSALIQVPK